MDRSPLPILLTQAPPTTTVLNKATSHSQDDSIRTTRRPPSPAAPTASSTTSVLQQNGAASASHALSQITIQPLTASTINPFHRVLALLLPIRYPDKFFSDTISDHTISNISRIAIWHDRPRPGKRKRESPSPTPSNIQRKEQIELPDAAEQGTVIGGIRCRLEPVPCLPSSEGQKSQHALYIQALALLSPYRGQGIATMLLDTVIGEAMDKYEGVESVYAHVWETNTQGLEWYCRRGFEVEEVVVEGYYRRLKPGGARIVRKRIEVERSAGSEQRKTSDSDLVKQPEI